MDKVDNIIIGFGKAGKTLAQELASHGESVVLVEQSKKMYGGTCINVACIPTKKLKFLAFEREELGYSVAMNVKNDLIKKLNKVNYDNVNNLEEARVIDGTASFVDEHTIEVKSETDSFQIQADRIFINTGARPFIPQVEGLELSERILTSEQLIELDHLPKKLAIIGAGPIGLELASIYAQFGSEVTLLNRGETILPEEDDDVREAVIDVLKEQSIRLIHQANIEKVEESQDEVTVLYTVNGDKREISASHLLVATGRHANIESLKLENASIESSDSHFIKVNEYLQTNHPHIFALGDVNGGPQQTYISLDDYRVVKDFLYGDKSYNTKPRHNVPTTTFIEPPLSKVGLNEKQATEEGRNIQIAKLAVNSIPKAKILEQTSGVFKAIIDADTQEILGATLLGAESHEIINIIATAMNAKMKYTQLRDQIFTHPTMAESLNDLFKTVK